MRCDVHTSSVVSRWVIPSICSFFPFPVMPHFVESGVSLVVSFMFGSSLSSRGLDFRGCVEFSKAMRAVQDARTNRRYYYLGRESKSTAEARRFRLLHAASKGDGASKEAGGPPRPGRADEALREELWPSAAATLSNDGGANRLSRTGGTSARRQPFATPPTTPCRPRRHTICRSRTETRIGRCRNRAVVRTSRHSLHGARPPLASETWERSHMGHECTIC